MIWLLRGKLPIGHLLLFLFISTILLHVLEANKVVVKKTVKKTFRTVPVDDPLAKDSFSQTQFVREDGEEGDGHGGANQQEFAANEQQQTQHSQSQTEHRYSEHQSGTQNGGSQYEGQTGGAGGNGDYNNGASSSTIIEKSKITKHINNGGHSLDQENSNTHDGSNTYSNGQTTSENGESTSVVKSSSTNTKSNGGGRGAGNANGLASSQGNAQTQEDIEISADDQGQGNEGRGGNGGQRGAGGARGSSTSITQSTIIRDNGGGRRRKPNGNGLNTETNEESIVVDQTQKGKKRRRPNGNGRAKGNGRARGNGRKKGNGPRTKLVADVEETEEIRQLKSQWNNGRSFDQSTTGSQCQSSTDGWTLHNGFYYKVLVGQMNHDVAHALCQKECAHLVSIHNSEDNNFVSDLIGKTGAPALGWWIGMHRKPIAGSDQFRSTWHDGTKMAFGDVPGRSRVGGSFEVPWSPGQPDFTSNVEECVHMWPVNDKWARMWNDLNCNAVLGGGVCMKPSASQSTDDDAYDDDDYYGNEDGVVNGKQN